MEEEDYEVEKVVAQRSGRGGRVEYQVKWVGWPLEDCTWEPLSALEDCQDVLRAWEARDQVADGAAATGAPKGAQKAGPSSSDAPAAPAAPSLATAPPGAPARARKKRAAESTPSGGKPTEEPAVAAPGDGKAAKRTKPSAAAPSAAPRTGAKAARGAKAGSAKAAGTKAAGVKAAVPRAEEVVEAEVIEVSDSDDNAQPARLSVPASCHRKPEGAAHPAGAEHERHGVAAPVRRGEAAAERRGGEAAR